MESYPDYGRDMLLVRVSKRVAHELRMARRQLAGVDINPHEGRLRASVMPVEYMDIPDFPPDSQEHNINSD